MKKTRRGFTLLELIIVIAILALLVAIALPRYNASREKAAITAHNANVKVLTSAYATYKAEKGDGVEAWRKDTEPAYKNYIDEWPELPKGLKLGEDIGGYTVSIDGVVSPGTIQTE